jgi:hypothetical protein
MTAEQVLQLHSEGFNRALTQQDYDALEGIYSELYMLVQPDGSVLNKQQILEDLREHGLKIHSIELEDAAVRVVGSVAILTAASKTVSSRNGKESRAHFRLLPSTARRAAQSVWSTFRARRLSRRRRRENCEATTKRLAPKRPPIRR